MVSNQSIGRSGLFLLGLSTCCKSFASLLRLRLPWPTSRWYHSTFLRPRLRMAGCSTASVASQGVGARYRSPWGGRVPPRPPLAPVHTPFPNPNPHSLPHPLTHPHARTGSASSQVKIDFPVGARGGGGGKGGQSCRGTYTWACLEPMCSMSMSTADATYHIM